MNRAAKGKERTGNGEAVGDNSDVRPPGPDEVWKGGVGGGGGRVGRSRGSLEKVTLTLDGVFFDDGGFVGPNQKGLWEQVVLSAEAQLQLARIAREEHDDGATPQKILAQIERVTGPATDHPPVPPPSSRSASTPEALRESALQRLAWEIGMARKSQGDERTVYNLLVWANEPLPRFRKLKARTHEMANTRRERLSLEERLLGPVRRELRTPRPLGTESSTLLGQPDVSAKILETRIVPNRV